MRHHPQHLMTSQTRRRVLQGVLGSVAGLATWQQGWRRLSAAAAQPREPSSGRIRRGEANMPTMVHQGVMLAYEDRGAGKPAWPVATAVGASPWSPRRLLPGRGGPAPYAKRGRRERARTELGTAVELYRTMDVTRGLPQVEAALAQLA